VDNATDKKAIRLLKGWLDKGFIDRETYQIFVKIFKEGTLLNLGKKITALVKKSIHEVVANWKNFRVSTAYKQKILNKSVLSVR